jgi:hypothetical protein
MKGVWKRPGWAEQHERFELHSLTCCKIASITMVDEKARYGDL